MEEWATTFKWYWRIHVRENRRDNQE